MAEKSWNLIPHPASGHHPWMIMPADVGGQASGYSVQKRTLRGGLCQGVEVISIDNGRLRFDVLPTRGMNVHRAWIDGQPIGWKSPVLGPVHPSFVPLSEPSGLGWLDGFDEWVARCGLESNGAPDFDARGKLRYGLHGRISNRPAHQVDLHVDGDSGVITLTGIVDETRFLFSKLRLTTTITTQVGERALEIHDSVQNLSASPAECQLLYHVNFGPPLLDEGARVTLPVRKLAPRDARAAEDLATWEQYPAAQPGYSEQVYFAELQADDQGSTRAVLANAAGTRASSLIHNTRQLPCFSLWKNTAAEPDGCVTGLEPATNFPNPRSFEGRHGRVVKLDGNARETFHLRFEFHQNATEVDQAIAAAQALQASRPEILDQPAPEWFAG
jgi:galactose mutarotase-like enzyme